MHDEQTAPRFTQNDLILSLEPLQTLLQHIPAAAYVCDSQSRVLASNAAARRIWGRVPKTGEDIRQLYAGFTFHSDDGRPIEFDDSPLGAKLQRTDGQRGAELMVESPDGIQSSFAWQTFPCGDSAGRRSATMWILEKASRSSDAIDAERFLASIVTSSDDAIVSKNLDGVIQSWNSGAERLFGYAANEAIGQPITMIIPPDLLDEEQRILERLRQGEHVAHYATWRVDKRGLRKPVSLSVAPIKDETGAIVGAAKVARDISSQKAAEAKLLELQHIQSVQLSDLLRLQQMSLQFSATLDLEPILQETLQTACALSDTSYGLLSLHDPHLDRLSIGASLGFDERFLQALRDQNAAAGACGRCLHERRRVIVENIATDQTFDGVREFIQESGIQAVHSTPLITRAGKLVGVLSLAFAECRRPSEREIRLLDICARQAVDYIENARLYQELREADHRKDEFLAVLAHELRNPLAPLKNALEIMRLSSDAGSTPDGLRAIMETQVQHLVRLVDDLLDVSRITRGKIELRTENVRLSSVIETAVETSRPHLDEAGHQLDIDLPDEPIRLQADPVRIAQVISNLLNNASKFTPRPGHIRLSAKSRGEEIVLQVRDNGQGISSEMLPRIFEMFSQVENVRSQANGGLGLGLAVSRALVELHGGTIDVSSDGPACGTCFTVRLPAAVGSSAVEEAGQSPRAVTKLPKRRIVVVDDTRVAAYILGRLLETLNQEVFVAYDGRTALELVRSRRPHVVISDIAMPEMDGYELATLIRQRDDLNGIRLVALTGYGQDADRLRTRAAGFDSHLVKPVGIGALQELLSTLPLVDTDH